MKRVALMMTVLFWAMFGYSPAYGQVYGEQLGEPEQRAMMETFQYALEYNKTNEASAWVNPDTGRSGTLVPVRTYQNESGQYCREYVTTITIGGEEVQGYGTACRQPDGTWLIVSDEPAAATKAEYQTVVNKVYYVYPYGYPYWYNYYPYYVWDYWYPHIFFSFDIVHFSGHHHHHHFHHGRHFHHWFHGHRWHHFDGRKHFDKAKRFDSDRRFDKARRIDGVKSFDKVRRFDSDKRFDKVKRDEGVKRFDGAKHIDRRKDFDSGKQFHGAQKFQGKQRSVTIHPNRGSHKLQPKGELRSGQHLGGKSRVHWMQGGGSFGGFQRSGGRR